MYEVKLISTTDPNHESNWFKEPTLQTAKNRAKVNYVAKYPNDNLAETEYVTKTSY